MVSHTQTAGGWATKRFFDKSDNEVLDLKRSCPDLPELPCSLQLGFDQYNHTDTNTNMVWVDHIHTNTDIDRKNLL